MSGVLYNEVVKYIPTLGENLFEKLPKIISLAFHDQSYKVVEIISYDSGNRFIALYEY